MPNVLEEIAANALGEGDGRAQNVARHALERLGEGFEVADLVQELGLLRASVFAVWRTKSGQSVDALALINAAIDFAITESTAEYVRALRSQRENVLAKLESLLAASPVGLAFVDRDLRYLRINAALAVLNGRPVEDHIGRTVREVLPAMADNFEPLLRGVMDTGEPVLNLELAVEGATPGDTRWLLGNYFPVRGPSNAIQGVGAIALDVTDTKRAEQALEMEQSRLRSIIDHAPASIWIKDLEGRIVLANRRLAEALGVDMQRLVGHRSDEVLPQDIAHQHQEHDRIVRESNRSIEVEETAPSPNGQRTFLSVKFPIPGEPPLIGAIATEITDRKRMELELREAVRIREDMMAIVSHDLRSPLGTVQLSATLLLAQGGHDQRAKRHLELIHRACTRMESLIDDLLDLASIRVGRFQVATQRERIQDVVSEALDLQAPAYAEQSISLVRSYELGEMELKCDRERITQVFANLLGNALKFCRAGDSVTVSARVEPEAVVFSVADTGPGIPPDRVAHLFDPYWSGKEHAARGAGLGLFIVRGIVESHGGRVWVESRAGEGATFFFTLPTG
jgi:PAS domain S-box-containing protein